MVSTTNVRRATRYTIRAEMQRRRLTQADVAARAGTSQQTVSRVIARRKNIDPETVARVWAELEALFAEYPPVNVRRRDGAAA
jgi:transcriptional regulator with XRE-family HTH domain